MNRNFYIGILLGALLAGAAFLIHDHYESPISSVSLAHRSKGEKERPQWWLLPKDFSLSKLYTQPEALTVLDAPAVITIHRAGSGSISVFGHTFATDGVSPSPEDTKTLQATFHALNSYTAVSMCEFQPGVLVRLKRGEHQLDLVVCFKCEDIAWVLDGHEAGGPQAGLSDLGIGTLRAVFQHAFPNDPAFKLQ